MMSFVLAELRWWREIHLSPLLPGTRTLVGGPLDGHTKTWLDGMAYEIAVECPFGGHPDVVHAATARYDRDGRYVKTYCRSTDTGEELNDAEG